MQTTGLARRLWKAFFPDKPEKKITMFRQYPGSEDEFFDYLERHGYEAKVPVDENNPRPTLYVTPDTGEIFAMCVRWPNRNYYYTLVQV
ncbi:hypothetical protein MLDJOKPK_00066 [Salmonella phage SPAsTU]|nr:hypothetical protein STsAS_075 [Salmonella phage STsAS]AXF51080.1 hypothetical protein MLDJOKPK_00066 [Salmonella phage SPAsTU]